MYRLQISFRDKQSNIALTFDEAVGIAAVSVALQIAMQEKQEGIEKYSDDIGNVVYVSGKDIQYIMTTDLKTDLEAMVEMQLMTAKAQMEAQKKAESFMPKIVPVNNH